jgi:O-antigen ligase
VSTAAPPSEDHAGASITGAYSRARRPLLRSAVVVGLLLWVVSGAMGGPRGALLASLIAVAVTVALIARPGLRHWLLDGPADPDVPPSPRGAFLTDLVRRTTGTPQRELVTAAVLVGTAVVIATAAATLGDNALTIIGGLVALLCLVAFIRNRTLFFMFALAASFSLILYKKFTPMLAESYAPAIYITTVDVLLVLLYAIWASEGTLHRDLKEGLRNPVFMLPVAGIAVTLLSAVNAAEQRLVWAEIVRYLFMTALFFYVGIRVRRREHIWAFMLGWLVLLAVQVVVSTSQRFTGGFLGIEILALKPDPLEPNSFEFMRPFGTQIHPVFLGCVVGMACLMVASFALHVPTNRITRYLLLSCIPLAFLPSFLARARGPLVALVPGVLVLVVLALRRRLISRRVVVVGLLLGLIGAGVFHQPVEGLSNSLVGSESNARENWDARWKINLIAYRMVREHPLVGTGINNFEAQIDEYTYEENPFDFRPAHNLYVLMVAETGILGLGMMLAIGLVLARMAHRLTRMRDPMYIGIGIGALATLVFVAFEELNSFTLKQDVPLAMFWTIFGLVVAANRMADAEAPQLPEVSWVRPPRSASPGGEPREVAR